MNGISIYAIEIGMLDHRPYSSLGMDIVGIRPVIKLEEQKVFVLVERREFIPVRTGWSSNKIVLLSG